MVVREDSINKESSGRNNEGTAMEDIDLGSTGIADSSQMDTTPAMNEENTTSKNYVNIAKETMVEPSSDGHMNAIDGDGDDETSTRISEPASALKFQPLQPIAEKSFSPNPHQSNPENYSTEDQNCTQTSGVLSTKESGSFMNNIQDPVAASKVFKKSQGENDDESLSSTQLMSHTPPTSMSTSYETTHFGKRPRSGVSFFLA